MTHETNRLNRYRETMDCGAPSGAEAGRDA
jgi:hypothetical protein